MSAETRVPSATVGVTRILRFDQTHLESDGPVMKFCVVCVLMLLAASCGSERSVVVGSTRGSVVESTSAQVNVGTEPRLVSEVRQVEVVGATFTYPPNLDAGVASQVVRRELSSGDMFTLLFSEPPASSEREVPLTFTLSSCVDEGGGRLVHEILWNGAPGLQLPLEATVWVGTLEETRLRGAVFDVRLDEEGVFRVTYDQPHQRSQGRPEELSVDTRTRPRPCQFRVLSETQIDDQTAQGLSYTASDIEPEVSAPARSIQSRATNRVPAGPLLRAFLLAAGPDSDRLPDRWLLNLEAEPASITINRNDLCWKIFTTWQDPLVYVVQHRGCEAAAWGELSVVTVDDDAWNVTVAGTEAAIDKFLSGATFFPVAGVDPVPSEGVTHDALATYEAQLARNGNLVIGRIPWGENGVIVVVDDLDFEPQADGFSPERFNGSGQGLPIQEGICVATMAAGNTEAGYAVVAYENPEIARIEVQRPTGEWELVTIIESGQYRLGLLDGKLTGTGNLAVRAPPIRGFDHDNNQLDCVRSD